MSTWVEKAIYVQIANLSLTRLSTIPPHCLFIYTQEDQDHLGCFVNPLIHHLTSFTPTIRTLAVGLFWGFTYKKKTSLFITR